MKVAILTYYEIANYGTLLQAYGLWKFLEARGHQVEFLDGSYGRSTSMDNRTISIYCWYMERKWDDKEICGC